MLSPRFRRLKLDHETITARFAGGPVIELTGAAGMPPEAYRIKGLFTCVPQVKFSNATPIISK